MLASRALHAPICASCRLRSAIAVKQLARSRKPAIAAAGLHRLNNPALKGFGTSTRRTEQRLSTKEEHERQQQQLGEDFADPEAEAEGVRYAKRLLKDGVGQQSPEKAALTARETYGDRLPVGVLDGEAYKIYERLYGKPFEVEGEDGVEEEVLEGEVEEMGEEEGGVVLLREGRDRGLEEVEVEAEELGETEGVEEECDDEVEGYEEDGEELGVEEDGYGRDDDARLRRDIESALSSRQQQDLEALPQEGEDEPTERAHPLTSATRFGTSPSTLPLPTATLLEPLAAQLAGTNNKHLSSAAHRALGGIGLPYGPATPARLKTMQQKPIQIDAFQHNVSSIEGDVFLAAVMPAVYASVVSVLTETRKRLGSAWAEGLVSKAERGELRILDAGGAGAGVLAVREMLRAEWERMVEGGYGRAGREGGILDSGMALAEAGGQTGGPGVSSPLGNATVVTGSDVLRHRAAKLLENTTFIPRLPDYVHTAEQKSKGKFDLVIAPHTLWSGFRFDRERKVHVQNLWSLLDANGGVLCLLEKGVSRGFEVVAGARDMLLRTRIQSAGSRGTEFDEDVYDGEGIQWEGAEEVDEDVKDTGAGWKTSNKDDASEAKFREAGLVFEKEKGTIIAPCTNHVACPMYRPRGFLKGRRDICAFEQRYVRPAFLQRILAAKDKNYEDVEFSYLSVMRGRDLLEERSIAQGEEATESAFVGFEAISSPTSPGAPSDLALPRQVLPPLKKKGHVLLDLCTPRGTLERWTIPRSFSKRAFRDARKSSWGDLWALGAKTRIDRGPRVNAGSKHGGRLTKGQRAEVRDMMVGGADGNGAVGRVGKRGVDVDADVSVRVPAGVRKEGKRGPRIFQPKAVGSESGSGMLVDVEVAGGELREGTVGTRTVFDTDEYGRLVVRDSLAGADAGGKKGGAKGKVGIERGEGGRMRTGQRIGGLRDKRDKSGRGNGRRKSSGWQED